MARNSRGGTARLWLLRRSTSCIHAVQGGPLSPLLSNIVLDLLDKELEKHGHTFARYADDFIILVGSKRAGERVLRSVTTFVERKLKLKVNDTKSQVAPVSQCKFLGFTFHGSSLKWHDAAVEKFKFQIKQLTGRSNGISMEKRIAELTVYLRGWINYFGIGQGYQKCIDLDHCLLIIEGGVDYACVTGPIVDC